MAKASNKLLVSQLIMSVIFSFCSPTIHKVLIDSLSNDNVIAIHDVIICMGGLIFGLICKKYSLFRYFKAILLSETILFTLSISLTVSGVISFSEYYLIQAVLVATITNIILFNINEIKSRVFTTPDSRRKYDDNQIIVVAIGSIFGFSLNILTDFSVYFSFIILTLGFSVDNLIIISVYNECLRCNKDR